MINPPRSVLVLLVFWLTALAPATAQPGGAIRQSVGFSEVIICPADMDEAVPPDFTDPACERRDALQVDPQERLIWVRFLLPPSLDEISPDRPYGLYLSAKAASEVWFNGVYLGANGQPGPSADAETPGRMDAVFFTPRHLIEDGVNRVDVRMSAHHGLFHINYPLHRIGLGPYAQPNRAIMLAYWPSLLTFGAFLLGMIGFGVAALRGARQGNWGGSLILVLISFFASGQLFTETARGLVNYDYPFHDLRVLAIAGFSFAFGLTLAAHVIWTFAPWRALPRLGALAAIAAITLILMAAAPGFDGKAAAGVFIPTIIACLGAGAAALARRPQASLYFFALLGFCGLIVFAPGRFLDTYFFYVVAALLLVFFGRQAVALVREKAFRLAEEARASRLEIALAEARERSQPSQLKISSSGRIEMLNTDKITHLGGAGDYVEVFSESGRPILHGGSLAGLEATLPPTFLRVHRSWIVNTRHVRSLERDPSGIGVLTLVNGAQIPVSRRIMPKVRSALAEAESPAGGDA